MISDLLEDKRESGTSSPPFTSTFDDSEDEKRSRIVSDSAVIVYKKVPEPILGVQRSAPYFFDFLQAEQLPPFGEVKHLPKARVFVGRFAIVQKNEVLEMVAALEKQTLKAYLSKYIVRKDIVKGWAVREREFVVSLMMEVIDYAAQLDLDELKLATILTIYLESHKFFKCHYWVMPAEIWDYFHELILKHTVEATPYGEEIFSPAEAYDILTHFHLIYMKNLPLIHINTFGVTKIRFTWPFRFHPNHRYS